MEYCCHSHMHLAYLLNISSLFMCLKVAINYTSFSFPTVSLDRNLFIFYEESKTNEVHKGSVIVLKKVPGAVTGAYVVYKCVQFEVSSCHTWTVKLRIGFPRVANP